MAVKEIVYLDRDNTVDLLLKADGSAQDLSAVTRMVLADVGGKFTVDSAVSASAFDWDTGTTGKVIIDIGGEDLPAGVYTVRLILIDPTNSNGNVWGDFELTIVQA